MCGRGADSQLVYDLERCGGGDDTKQGHSNSTGSQGVSPAESNSKSTSCRDNDSEGNIFGVAANSEGTTETAVAELSTALSSQISQMMLHRNPVAVAVDDSDDDWD